MFLLITDRYIDECWCVNFQAPLFLGEKNSAPRSSIALLEWFLSIDVRGVWDTTTSEAFISIREFFWYMLPCKHHCMPQSTSLLYMRVCKVTFSCCHGRKAAKLLNSQLQVSEFEFSSMELLEHPVVTKNNMVSSPALNTCALKMNIPLHSFITRCW